MDRRSFFKVVGAVTAATALPAGATVLLEATQPVPVGMFQLGLIRELYAYDISRDALNARYDVLALKPERLQLSVYLRLSCEHVNSRQYREEQRWIAKGLLEDEMKHRGLAWSDITPLPVPRGYKPPKWPEES